MKQPAKTIKYFLILSLVLSLTSCDSEGGLLIEPDITASELVLLSPADNVEIATTSVNFFWEPVNDAYTYEIQVATPSFENAAQFLLNREDSTTTAQLELPIGDYQWRVRAKNSNYATGYSTASFFVVAVEDFSNNEVILESPDDNVITNIATQNLQWQPIDGASLYRIQLELDGSTYEEFSTTDTVTDVTFDEGENTWRVRAENGTQNTLYFSRDILVDLTPPNQPTLSSPTDGEEVTSADVSFQWSRPAISGSQEIDSIYVYRDINLTDLVSKEQSASPYQATLDNDTYYWYVKAFDGAGNQSDASETFSVTVNE